MAVKWASAEMCIRDRRGVAELVQNYAVDGIHFDDYFYPTTDAALDAATSVSYTHLFWYIPSDSCKMG